MIEQTITFDDFTKVDMRVGTVLNAEPNLAARKAAYVLTIDFGELGIKTSSAQITHHYSTDDLIGSQVIAVMNFPAKRIAGVNSEVLVLGAPDSAAQVVLLRPSTPVKNGVRIF
ncbi:MAG TPA: tRNA-binding protein [Phototrophicaceae bacterium]|jgi:tRNA-binding protein|nr:tRNA-binding protein [Phototrophicaceae bacterium]